LGPFLDSHDRYWTWYSLEKLRSISGVFSPSQPKKVSKGKLWPSIVNGEEQWGQLHLGYPGLILVLLSFSKNVSSGDVLGMFWGCNGM